MRMVVCTGLAVGGLPAPSAAAPRVTPRVVIVRQGGSAVLEAQIGDEIRAMGWEVSAASPGAGEAGSLARAASRAGAAVALRMSPQGLELWISDPAMGGAALHEVLPVNDSEDVVALRVVEILRVRLLRLGFDLGGARENVSVAPAAEDAPRRGPPPGDGPSEIWLGGAWTVAAGSDLGPSLHAELGARWVLSPGSLGVVGLLPVGSLHVEAAEGRADVQPYVAALTSDFLLELTPDSKGLIGVLVGAAALRTEGHARPPWLDRSDWAVGGLVLGHLGFWQRLGSRLALRIDLRGGVVAPRPVVRFDDRVRASFGDPLLTGSIGLEVRPF